jgi:molybdate transport system substrate-binding protein
MRAHRSFPLSPGSSVSRFSHAPSRADEASPSRSRQIPLLAFSALLLLVLGLSACGGSSPAATGTATPQPVTLNVFAADSLTTVFTKIGSQFHALHPSVTVRFNFAGSDTLAAQINQGAPADVYASANVTQMNVAVSAGSIDPSSVQVFAHNHIVVIIPKSNPGNIQTLQDLAKPGVKIVLGASTVPAGAYALQFLTMASADPSYGSSYKADVLKNVVSYQSDVGGVLSQVSTGDADAGIVYISDALTEPTTLSTIAIPDNLAPTAVYPIAPVKSSPYASTAAEVVAYVMSSAGQSVLTGAGFLGATDGPGYTPPSS